MAEEEPMLTSPPTQDVAVHVRDYERFTKLLKWGAIVCLDHRLHRPPDPQLAPTAHEDRGPEGSRAGETRCAAIPETVKKFIALGRRGRGRDGRRRGRVDRRRRFRGRRAQASAAARRCSRAPASSCASTGPTRRSLEGRREGRAAGRRARPAAPARGDRRLCRGRARGAGDGMDAAHHPRPVDGHPVVAVEPRRLQGGGRRRRRLWPRLPDDDDRGRHDQPGQGVRHGRRRRRAAGDRHRPAPRRAGQRDRRPLGDQGADPVARRQADLRRECRRHRGRGRRRLRDRNVGGISEGAGRAGLRPHRQAGHRHHHRADPRPAGAAADQRRAARDDAAGQRDRRPGGRSRRQCRGHGRRRDAS